jgi:hypothetical protein
MSKFSESIDDAYFTCPEDVQFVHQKLNEYGWIDGTVLEPCKVMLQRDHEAP